MATFYLMPELFSPNSVTCIIPITGRLRLPFFRFLLHYSLSFFFSSFCCVDVFLWYACDGAHNTLYWIYSVHLVGENFSGAQFASGSPRVALLLILHCTAVANWTILVGISPLINALMLIIVARQRLKSVLWISVINPSQKIHGFLWLCIAMTNREQLMNCRHNGFRCNWLLYLNCIFG